MAWIVEERRKQVGDAGPFLTPDLKKILEDKYFPRYPTKRAVLLPALHLIQHTYNWIPPHALQETAEFLGISPAEAMDTATFYEEYWLKPKGKYLLQVCRSLACEICDAKKLTEAVRNKLKIEIGETTPDGRFTLVELECLGACGNAPCALVNDVIQEDITPDRLTQLLDTLPDDPHNYHDPEVTWSENDH